MHTAPQDAMQLLRKDVCRLSEGLWKSLGKLSKDRSITGVSKPELDFFLSLPDLMKERTRGQWILNRPRAFPILQKGSSTRVHTHGQRVSHPSLIQVSHQAQKRNSFCAFMQENTNSIQKQLSRPSCAWAKDTCPSPHMPPVLEVSAFHSWKLGFREINFNFERV